MKLNIKEIVQSWAIKINPTEKQKKMAEERYAVCVTCPSNVKVFDKAWSEVCNECGCPLQAKIFSPKYDACDLHKWIDIENRYSPNGKLHPKNNKTTI
jgi:hypothetical protein